jgi:hypothetical protein
LAGFEVTLYGRFWVTPEELFQTLFEQVGLEDASVQLEQAV